MSLGTRVPRTPENNFRDGVIKLVPEKPSNDDFNLNIDQRVMHFRPRPLSNKVKIRKRNRKQIVLELLNQLNLHNCKEKIVIIR